MKAVQQRRWKKVRGEWEPFAPAKPQRAKPNRKLSVAGRRAISEASEKQWALKRVEAAKEQRAAKESRACPEEGCCQMFTMKPAAEATRSRGPRARHAATAGTAVGEISERRHEQTTAITYDLLFN